MATIKIKQTKSRIGAPIDQKRTLNALGLTKMNHVVEKEDTPVIQAAFRLQQEDWFRRWPDAFAASLAEVRLQEYQSC